jgi:hypothetical protein
MPSRSGMIARPQGSTLWLILAAGVLACGDDSLDVTPTTGTITVTTGTSGVEQDPDGYTVQIDSDAPVAVGVTGSLENTGIVPGQHSVLLGGVAANCTVGDNPRVVSVTAGQGVTVAFEVTCTATTGSLQVSTTTTGSSPDADGYSLTVDGAERSALGPSGALTVAGLAPGDHLVGLSGVAGNCQPIGDNPRAVTVTAGASINVAFTITCVEPTPDAGTLQVTTTTTGPDIDPNGYVVAVDGETSQPIGVAAQATVTNVAAGQHTVRLANVAGNCLVEGNNPRPISVPGGATAQVSFAVTCTAITGSVNVSVTTTGAPLDPDGYTAKLDGRDPGLAVPSAGTVTFTAVPPGSHAVALTGVAANCSVTAGESQSATVTAGARADLSFAVTCAATTGSIQVTTVVTGTSLDPDGYLVSVDGGAPQTLDNNASLSVGGLAPGAHDVALSGIAANCQLTGESPASLTVTAGVLSSVTFTLNCPGTGVSRWTPMTGGGANELVSVWGTGPSDVFAVGSGSDGVAVILHYAGSTWSEQLSRPYLFGPSTFNGVWANTPTDVYAVGILVEEGFTGSVYHYDGTGWTPMTLPRIAADDLFYGVWGLSGTEIFAFGVYQHGVGDYTPLILRYDGTAWQTFPVPPGAMYISDMWGTSATDLYATGGRFESPSQLVLHYDGSSWSIVQEASSGHGAAYTIWASSASDVFVGQAAPPLLHYDGAAWSPMTAPSTAPVFGLWGTSATDVFATSGGAVLHYDGAIWTSTPTLIPHRLLALWGSSPTDVFAVGENGTILHGTQ